MPGQHGSKNFSAGPAWFHVQMSLKVKLSLVVVMCACCPIIALEGYRSWVSYHEQVADAQSSLLKGLQDHQNTVTAFFDDICGNIRLVA